MNDLLVELLLRALDGEPLEAGDAARLQQALADPAIRAEAIAWVRWQATASDQMRQNPETLRRSRERLFAKVILREKRASLTPPPVRPVNRRRRPVILLRSAAVAALALVVLVVAAWFLAPAPYQSPLTEGSIRLLGSLPGDPRHIEREDRFVAIGGVEMELGGYCDIELAENTEVTVKGSPHKEKIELHQGQIRARVTPRKGQFEVLTPLGLLEVIGTEFETIVEYPVTTSAKSWDRDRAVQVTVAVSSGAVICRLSDPPLTLNKGDRRVFTGELPSAHGSVVAAAEATVTLKTENSQLTFHAAPADKLAVREASALRPGDQVSIEWYEHEGQRYIQNVRGEGTLRGIVTDKQPRGIEVAVEGQRPQLFTPHWIGGMPRDGGGLDRKMLQQIRAAPIGAQVELTWSMSEGKRVTGLRVLEPEKTREKPKTPFDPE
ncbi:FecR domain-containing protein [Lignipirellula cremea]|uniref:FecR protein n=1 Tax=Lignipirellula cremea TaxID=2528010 RepID=A0A518DVR6_9BACT|nr:FecR domain-containing protein [Lignipirellula cremea]QDU95927.1 FecR protein [Lignipirellula cremea]